MADPGFTADDAKLIGAVEAALAAGNMQAATEISSILKQNRLRNTPLPPPVKLGQEGMPEAIKSEAAAFSPEDQRLAGAGTAPVLAYEGLKGLVGAGDDARVQNMKAISSATPNTTLGNVAGNAGMFASMPLGGVGTAMGVAGKTLPRWGAVADMAATQGGVAAATTPGDASERLLSGMLGVAGAAAPGAVGAGQSTRRALTKTGKQMDLSEGLYRELGPDAEALATQLKGSYPGSSYGVQPTSAMLTKNPTLEVLETGSRVRTPDQWTNFDRANAAARWKALEDAAGTPKELEQLKAARDALTSRSRDSAIGSANRTMAAQVDDMDLALRDTLDAMKTGAQRPNKDVQTMVSYVESELSKGVTPEQLYTIRKVLTDGIKSGQGNELTQAARAARPQRMEIIGKIDEALNALSDGGWSKYLDEYKISSPLINSREALGNMRDALMSGRPVGEIPASMGEKPAPYAFGKLLEREGTKTFGSKEFDRLIPQHRALADTLLSDLNAQAGVMQPRATLGSPTAGNLANAGRVNQLTSSMIDAAGNMLPVGGNTVAASVKGSLARMNEEALAELLRNPQGLSDALRKARASAELLKQSGRVGAGADAAYRAGME